MKVRKVRPRWRRAEPSIINRVRDSSASTTEPMASTRHCGIATTGPSKLNFCWRAALNTPQYAPADPSSLTFHGWSKASITK